MVTEVGYHIAGALDTDFNNGTEAADLYYEVLPLFFFPISFCSSCSCSPEAFCPLKADHLHCDPRCPNTRHWYHDHPFSRQDVSYLCSTSKLGFPCIRTRRELSGEFEEFLLPLICGLTVILMMRSPVIRRIVACWWLCRLCRMLLPRLQAVLWH